jgi:hypothetical protein
MMTSDQRDGSKSDHATKQRNCRQAILLKWETSTRGESARRLVLAKAALEA